MNFVKRLWRIVPHSIIVLSLVFLTFIVLDWYNPLMGFLSNTSSTTLLAALCTLSILYSAGCIVFRSQEACGHKAHSQRHRR